MAISMMNEAAIREWIAAAPQFVLFNAAKTPHPQLVDIPVDFNEGIGDRRIDLMAATCEELDRLGVVLSHDEKRVFEQGKPILVAATGVEHRPSLKRGRRRKEQLERDVQTGLAAATYAATERLIEWTSLRDGRRVALALSERRERVLQLLADEAKQVFGAKGRCGSSAYWRTQYDAGSRIVAGFHADIQRPGQLADRARHIVCSGGSQMRIAEIDQAIRDEISRLMFLSRCLDRATEFVLAAHDIRQINGGQKLSKGQQAVLASTHGDHRPSLYDVTRAAFDGDFDGALLFPSLIVRQPIIELARLLGRAGRGHAVEIGPNRIGDLQTVLLTYEVCLQHLEKDIGLTAEQGASFWVAKAALELAPLAAWKAGIESARRAGDTISLNAH